MKSKKVRLNDNSPIDFYLLGISSYEKDYRLIWTINNELGMEFSRTDNLKLYHPKTANEQEFIRYIYRDEDRYIYYRFLANRSEEGFLLDELKNIDYLILIDGQVTAPFLRNLRNLLSELENVQGVFTIHPGDLKNKQRLITAV